MVEEPKDKIDVEDYGSFAEYIAAAMEVGYTIEASDFEGRPCSYCGDLLDFAEWQRDPDTFVTWDIPVQDPGDEEPEPYVARTYFCSEGCRDKAMRSPDWLSGDKKHGEADRIHVEDLEGMA